MIISKVHSKYHEHYDQPEHSTPSDNRLAAAESTQSSPTTAHKHADQQLPVVGRTTNEATPDCPDDPTPPTPLKSFELRLGTKAPRSRSSEKPFTCRHCLKTYARADALGAHQRRHHTGATPSLRCAHCPALFQCKDLLHVHERSHTGELPLRCDQCDASCASKWLLDIHMRTHTRPLRFGCEQCGKRFWKNSLLVLHTRTHTGEKPFVCQLCGMAFARKQGHDKHMRLHRGEKPHHHCALCPATFAVKASLTDHLLTHPRSSTFTCDLCHQVFGSRPDILKHMHRWHITRAPITCEHCPNKTFPGPCHLVIHQRMHTGEKPFLCEHCSDAFISKSNLTRHIRKRHK